MRQAVRVFMLFEAATFAVAALKGVLMSIGNNTTTDEAAIRELIEDWTRSVRAKNVEGILAHHSAAILMFDVPPPFESKGIEAYRGARSPGR